MRDPGCPTCGEPLTKGSPPHETVKRVVRPGARYGYPPAVEGQEVEIEPRHLNHPSALSCLYTAEEYQAELAGKAAKRKPQAPGQLAAMVAAGQAAVNEQVRVAIERGKANLEREARNAEEAAARARLIDRELREVSSGASRDQEASASESREVVDAGPIPDQPLRTPVEEPRLREQLVEQHDGLWY